MGGHFNRLNVRGHEKVEHPYKLQRTLLPMSAMSNITGAVHGLALTNYSG